MNRIATLLFGMILLSAMGCQQSLVTSEPDSADDNRSFTLNLFQKSLERSIIKDKNTEDIFIQWEHNSFDLNLFYVQGGAIIEGGQLAPTEISADGSSALFDLLIPQEIDINRPFDLFGVIADRVKVKDGKLLVGVDAHTLYNLDENSSNRDNKVPMYFKVSGVTEKSRALEANFQHLGAMAMIVVMNSSEQPFVTSGFSVVPKEVNQAFYLNGSLPFKGNSELPYINLLEPNSEPQLIRSEVVYPVYTLNPGEVSYNAFWFRPLGGAVPEVELQAYDAASKLVIKSTATIPSRKEGLIAGRAYTIFAEWDGQSLKILEDEPFTPLPENQEYIEITTLLNKGEHIFLNVNADIDEKKHVWIDLNNNGKREKGEFVMNFSSNSSQGTTPYLVNSQTIRVYGKVKSLVASNQKISRIDVQSAKSLEVLSISGNNISQLNLSQNSSLKRLLANQSGIEEFTLPKVNNLQEIYLIGNNLPAIELNAPMLYAVEVGGNPNLKDFNLLDPEKHTKLMVVGVNDCNLNKEALEAIYTSLMPPMIQKYYDWMFTIYSYGNPGSSDADFTIATKKNWTVYQTNKDNPDSGN